MTVASSESIRESFACGTGITTFLFTMPCYSASDIEVRKRLISTGAETTLAETTDYTIAATGGDYLNGGTVTILVELANTYEIHIVRKLVKTQELATASVTHIALAASLDKLTRIVQDLQERLDRAVHLKNTDDVTTLELPTDRNSKYAAFDSSGNIIASAGPVGDSEIPVSSFMEDALSAANAAAFIAALSLGTASLLASDTDGTLAANSDSSIATQKAVKTYVDTLSALCAKLAGNQTIAGVKTFSSFPVTPSSAPTTDYQVANKKYADDAVATGSTFTAYTTKDSNNDDMVASHAYKATINGFVYAEAGLTAAQTLYGYVGTTNDPYGAGVRVGYQLAATSSGGSIAFEVAIDEYFEIRTTGSSLVIRFKGRGTLGNPVDQD
ncbi:MAG: hypothetical protein PHG53_09545 [Phycisphaerae bacterium]|nr:hypothetical protein [Phycisphaerae bacterium]